MTTFTHDTSQRLIEVQEPDPDGTGPKVGHTTEFAYHSATNLVASMTLPSGTTTSYAFDFARRLETKTNPDTTDKEYEPLQTQALVDTSTSLGTQGNPAPLFAFAELSGSRTNELDQTTAFTTDRFGFETSQTDALGHTTTFERNEEGLVTVMTQPDPDGTGPLTSSITLYSYDERNNLTGMTLPDSSTLAWTYEETFNQLTSYTDELGRLTQYEIDPATGNLLSLRRVVGQVDDELNLETDDVLTSFTYTAAPVGTNDPPAGLVSTETDPLGRVTSFLYDRRGNVTRITYAAGTSIEAYETFEYNTADDLTAHVDELGRRTEYTHDNIGRLIKVTRPDPDGAGPLAAPETQYQHNAMDRVTKQIDPLGRETSYAYGAFGKLVSVTQPDPDGAGPLAAPVTQYDYDDAGNLLTVTDPLGRVTTYAHDDAGQNTSITLPDPDGAGPLTSPVTQFVFDPLGRLTETTDPLANATEVAYENFGREITVTLPLTGSPTLVRTYDAGGQLISEVDPLGRETTYEFDALGRLVKITQPDPDGGGALEAPVTELEYDKAGNLVLIIDPRGGVTQHVYDERNRRTQTTLPDPDGAGSLAAPVWEFGFDDAGQLVSQMDPLGRVTSYSWLPSPLAGVRGLLASITQPDPDGAGPLAAPVTLQAYDAAGRLTSVTDALGKVTNYGYDPLDRQTSILLPDPDGAGPLGRPETVLAYDAVGNRLSLTDPVGNVTSWQFDNLNRMIAETNELSDTRQFEFDAANNLVRVTDRLGRVRELAYDELHRLTQETWLDGQTTVNTLDFTFDAASQLTAAADDFSDYAFAYDGLGRITQIDVANGGPLARLMQEFDASGNRTSLAAALDAGSGWVDDFLTTSTFDALNRLTRLEQEGVSGGNPVAEKRIDFAYNAASQFATITRYSALAGGSTNLVASSAYGYDGMGRLTDLTHARNSTTFADYNWTFDTLSRVTQMSFTSLVGNDGVSNYSYDTTDQLTDADHDFQTDEDYSFDENGNRTMSGYDTDDNNQLASDGVWNFTYDAEGNRLSQTRISSAQADDKTIEYTWDHRNRLTQLLYKNNSGMVTKQINYTYDLFNRRIKKEIDLDGAGIQAAALQQFLYDGEHIILAFDTAGDITNRYLPGPVIDMILADEHFDPALETGDMLASPGDLRWALPDNLGTVRDLVDSAGNVLNHITYDAFGQITSETGTTVAYAFGYTGRERDLESDLDYYRARYYDAAAGRFISEDPLGFVAGDYNLTRYVSNAPVNATDPTGLEEASQRQLPHRQAPPVMNTFMGPPVESDSSGFWSDYWHYLTNPADMDDGLETAFYVSAGVGCVAGLVAGGVAVYGAVAATGTAQIVGTTLYGQAHVIVGTAGTFYHAVGPNGAVRFVGVAAHEIPRITYWNTLVVPLRDPAAIARFMPLQTNLWVNSGSGKAPRL